MLKCDLAKTFFTFKFSFLGFSNPIHKTKLGLQIGGRLLIANHVNKSLWLANQTRNNNQIIFITIFSSRS
jgi:hypothetical protein